MLPSQTGARVHPDHIAAWGESLGARGLGQTIFANARLKARAAARIAEHYGLAPSESLLQRPAIKHSVASVIADRDRMVRICGLVAMRGIMLGAISRGAYQALAAAVSADELEYAASLMADLPPAEKLQVNADRLGERITQIGEAVLRTWHGSLSAQARQHLAFAFGEDAFDDGGGAMHTPEDEAVAIVELAARGPLKR